MDDLNLSSATAYLAQAAIEIANQEGFTPSCPEEMRDWLDRNRNLTVERARILQEECFHKYISNREPIVKIIAAQIWGEVRNQ
jgi:hypothetical protein